MSLPNIKINFENGTLGTVAPNTDGVFGLAASAVATNKFELEKPYMVKSMKQVNQLEISEQNNYGLYKTLTEFFTESGEGRELWLLGMPKSAKMSSWFTLEATSGKTPIEKLLDAANGKLSGIFTKFSPDESFTSTITEGIEDDILEAANKAQILAESYTDKKYAPFFVLLEGYEFNGDVVALADLTTKSYNRVAIMIGDTEKRSQQNNPSKGSAIGILAGRLAANQVHVNAGRVKDGALTNLHGFILDEQAEIFDVEALHDKGYITFRTHIGKSGYFFSDDVTASSSEDDYHHLTNRRVIDKAYRITYQTLVNYLLDEVEMNNDGTINAHYAKNMEGDLANALIYSMSSFGELSTDTEAKDYGVKVFVDPTQNIASTSRIEVAVKVRPHGYARFIDVLLGFDINTNKQ